MRDEDSETPVTHRTIDDAYQAFCDLHGSAVPSWSRHELLFWLIDQNLDIPYTQDQVRAAYDAELAE